MGGALMPHRAGNYEPSIMANNRQTVLRRVGMGVLLKPVTTGSKALVSRRPK